nr:hypothetical protein [Tanacetum cinerariifolium]
DYNSEKDLQVSKLKIQTNDSSLPGNGAKILIGFKLYPEKASPGRSSDRGCTGCDALAYSRAEANHGISAPNDFIHEQQGKSNASPAEREKNTYSATKEVNLKKDSVDLTGIDTVEAYHKKKLLYDKYCDKMLKRKKSPKITNCDVLSKKGPIALKVYREDETG